MISGLDRPSSRRRAIYAWVWASERRRVMTTPQSAELAWRSPPRLSRRRVTLPEDAWMGDTPHRWAQAAS